MDQLNTPPRALLREATEEDRQEIYHSRHDVYAVELGQYPASESGRLENELDRFNHYVSATIDGRLAGFISLTPPGGNGYSIDGYLDRSQWPFEVGPGLFEVRLLTVVASSRRSILAPALMYAAFRLAEANGGQRLMAIGRTEVASIYRSIGLDDHGIEVSRGKVRFRLMSAPLPTIRREIDSRPRLVSRIQRQVDWQVDFPFRAPATG